MIGLHFKGALVIFYDFEYVFFLALCRKIMTQKKKPRLAGLFGLFQSYLGWRMNLLISVCE